MYEDLGESGGWYTCDSGDAIYYIVPHSGEDVSAEGRVVSYSERSVGLRYIPGFLPSRCHWTHVAAPLGLIGGVLSHFRDGARTGMRRREVVFARSANRIVKCAGRR